MLLNRFVVGLLLSAVSVGLLGRDVAAKENSVKIGQQIEALTFKDIRFLPRTLDDFGDKQAVVIICANTTCPLVKRYLPTIKRLEEKYRDDGVQFVLLNVAASDSILEMAEFAVQYGINFPAVKDADGSCVAALGMTRTPEVAVLDGEHRLQYRGRINDQYRIGGALPKATHEYLADAIDAVLKGEPVAVPQTPVDGCLITSPTPVEPNDEITFAKHIEPIIRKHCVECHRPGTEAPFGLTTYDEVAGQGEMIAEVVTDGRMPPRFAGHQFKDFYNLREMTSQEREQIEQWVAAEMPRGTYDGIQPPAAVEPVSEGWVIGEPDLVLTMVETHQLPADGYIDYKYVTLPHVFTDDTWVQAIQILPDNPSVVHHCNILSIPVGGNWRNAGFITGKVPGSGPLTLANGVAQRIPARSVLAMQIHYTSTGKPEESKISVGFRFARGKVKKELRHILLKNNRFEIPPGDGNHPVTSSQTLEEATHGFGLFTHMHLRGKDMTYLAHYPDGKTETLLIIPNYSFDWQMGYRWKPHTKLFPAGTRFEVVAHFDNSTFNPFNPDPKDTVREGQQTFHEMMYGFYFYTHANEDLNMEVDLKTGHAVK
ncbi:Thiol-disulfide oxidoreductase ResA [Symmachiella dynata]|uniref:redoxin family protein n=1 Tax=Symmachiella dynata TaxID=2527995 RepID=UPI001189C7EF|nr:redoxin family protein [Symmachiella dynata]QDT48812.1 Thiol-disulfide oxidoreductase ResA [Symmachiella dynata]